MPFRAFGDSDPGMSGQRSSPWSEFQCPFGYSGILTDLYPPTSPPAGWVQVSMPFRAFGDSDVQVLAVYGFFLHVSMPFRAFGDSDWT